ncbi:uncharacterized protein MONBRDRAFT_28676 [Monosiga brevicollis MX1]|uniref:Protein kinase domain-containing protein n=1 Tax=Monosiga brevicollis TaxID=81824 RepID=A9V8V2_MONBE|nr:uncharacterized protein MONBRDRAFT_28676 [Monosiga brevicollis MX1]EDQ86025.1 predicted protein [Monosiga brevicollis MX1]|eukprot:XP_001749219.1 hypothetical protein [Monosiga brevicollis MX1]
MRRPTTTWGCALVLSLLLLQSNPTLALDESLFDNNCQYETCRPCNGMVFMRLDYALPENCAFTSDFVFPHGHVCNFGCDGAHFFTPRFVCMDGEWRWPLEVTANETCSYYAACTYNRSAEHGPSLECPACGRSSTITTLPSLMSADLEYVDVSCQALTSISRFTMLNLRRLRYFNASHNGNVLSSSKAMRILLALETLDVSYTDLEDQLLSPLFLPSLLENLTSLQLHGMPVHFLDPDTFAGTFPRACDRNYSFAFSSRLVNCTCALDPTPGDCGRITCSPSCFSILPEPEPISCTNYMPNGTALPTAWSEDTLDSPQRFCDGHIDCRNGFDEQICDFYLKADDDTNQFVQVVLVARHSTVTRFIMRRGLAALMPDLQEPIKMAGTDNLYRIQMILKPTFEGDFNRTIFGEEYLSFNTTVRILNQAQSQLILHKPDQVPLVSNMSTVSGFPNWAPGGLVTTAFPTSSTPNAVTTAPRGLASHSNLNTGVIVGATLACVLVLTAIGALLLVTRQRQLAPTHRALHTARLALQASENLGETLPKLEAETLFLDPDQFDLGQDLGRGHFGRVAQARWHDGDQQSYVAIKIMPTTQNKIASALAFLHGRQTVHRDLASRNVLLCNLHTCKLADFGCMFRLESAPIIAASTNIH